MYTEGPTYYGTYLTLVIQSIPYVECINLLETPKLLTSRIGDIILKSQQIPKTHQNKFKWPI